MRIKLIIHSFNDWPQEWKAEEVSHGESLADTLANPWAYTNDLDVVHVRHPAELRILGGLGRVWHELWHILTNDDEHHPWWHFCVATKMPFRLPIHGNQATREAATALLRDGYVEVPDA